MQKYAPDDLSIEDQTNYKGGKVMSTVFSGDRIVKISANVATVLLGFLVVVQLLLAVGILPISIAWGGRQSELTTGLQIASVVAAFILGVFIYVIRYRAGLVGSTPIPTAVRIGAWVVTGFMALNTLGNFASANTTEKLLFGPIAIIVFVACLVVSLSKARA
jgi:hypothetical protein